MGARAPHIPPPPHPVCMHLSHPPTYPTCCMPSFLPPPASQALMEGAGVPVVPGYHGEDQAEGRLQVCLHLLVSRTNR